MSFGVDAKNSLLGIGMSPAHNAASERQCSILEAAFFAYGVLFRRFGETLRAAWFSFFLAALLLYTFLNGYLSKLLLFMSAPNSHVASLGLGFLAAGIFLSLFCYTVAIAAVVDLVQNCTVARTIFRFKARRQEW